MRARKLIPTAASPSPSPSPSTSAGGSSSRDSERPAAMAKGIPLEIGLRVGGSLGAFCSTGERRESLPLSSGCFPRFEGGPTAFPAAHNVHVGVDGARRRAGRRGNLEHGRGRGRR